MGQISGQRGSDGLLGDCFRQQSMELADLYMADCPEICPTYPTYPDPLPSSQQTTQAREYEYPLLYHIMRLTTRGSEAALIVGKNPLLDPGSVRKM